MSGPLLSSRRRSPASPGDRTVWRWIRMGSRWGVAFAMAVQLSAEAPPTATFRQEIQPLLKQYCYDCHGDGEHKGDIGFDTLASDSDILNPNIWFKVLKNVRAGLMPPAKKTQPSASEKQKLEHWIKYGAFGLDPDRPDPGKVTVRRLNRVEYRNTVRDLIGVDFDTEKEFPADDAGYGFDNIGDVLTLSPMLLEKYLGAARTIVGKAVPSVPKEPAEQTLAGRSFTSADAGGPGNPSVDANSKGPLRLSYYQPAEVSRSWEARHAGHYQVRLDLSADERFVDNQFDYNRCRLTFKIDGKPIQVREYARESGQTFHFEFAQEWAAGTHQLTFSLEPLTPDQPQIRSLTLRLEAVTVRGPMEPEHWVRPANFERYFSQDAPDEPGARRQYARSILEPFVMRAYRRPVEGPTVDRLLALAEATSSAPGQTFEAGIGQAMVAVLASPRFLFREEAALPTPQGIAPDRRNYPLVDEYSLASRLSYFLWSSMPDAELFRLAGEGHLRKNLDAQWRRMLQDRKSDALVRNFVGQWLQARDVETAVIDGRQVFLRDAAPDPQLEARRARLRALRNQDNDSLTPEERTELATLADEFSRRSARNPGVELTGELRRAMRQETEKTFDFILRNDRSLLELLDGDYTFLNARLARHYGLTDLDIQGDEMRWVQLPPDSPRGGILTQGTVLVVTSNPTRTSPVKRGLFVLDNLLGTPPPPPPPNIPPLEDAAKGGTNHPLTLRETLALHREKPLCSSCHNRMDPLGLALENFNALGMWRQQERGQPIDATGKLLTGESFANVRELKKILASQHRIEFYRTLTQKLLTYALGRGLEYYDVETVDAIVEQLDQSNGKPSVLLTRIIDASPFQRTREAGSANNPRLSAPSQQRADARLHP